MSYWSLFGSVSVLMVFFVLGTRSCSRSASTSPARWQSGYAAACKAAYAGSIPTLASIPHLAAALVSGMFVSSLRLTPRCARGQPFGCPDSFPTNSSNLADSMTRAACPGLDPRAFARFFGERSPSLCYQAVRRNISTLFETGRGSDRRFGGLRRRGDGLSSAHSAGRCKRTLRCCVVIVYNG